MSMERGAAWGFWSVSSTFHNSQSKIAVDGILTNFFLSQHHGQHHGRQWVKTVYKDCGLAYIFCLTSSNNAKFVGVSSSAQLAALTTSFGQVACFWVFLSTLLLSFCHSDSDSWVMLGSVSKVIHDSRPCFFVCCLLLSFVVIERSMDQIPINRLNSHAIIKSQQSSQNLKVEYTWDFHVWSIFEMRQT